MKSLKIHIFGLALGACVLAAACAKPPTQEIADAENAVNAAIQAGAEEYAPAELKAAQDALADTNTRVENKDYKGAKDCALDAKSKADVAAQAVEPNKKALKTDVETKMAALKKEMDAIQATVSRLKGKGTEQYKSDAAALKTQWEAIQTDVNGGSYKAAADKIAEGQAKLDALKASLKK